MSLAVQVVEQAKAAGKVLATAESCTGGMIAVALTDVPGSSAVLDGGYITYSNHAKTSMLAVQVQSIARYGAVSEQVACEMAQGALTRSEAHIAIAVTGIAGPGGSDHKPEGRVCFGLAQAGQEVCGETVDFGALGRPNVRAAARDHALTLLSERLKSA